MDSSVGRDSEKASARSFTDASSTVSCTRSPPPLPPYKENGRKGLKDGELPLELQQVDGTLKPRPPPKGDRNPYAIGQSYPRDRNLYAIGQSYPRESQLRGLRPELVPWVCSFISGRKQCVRYRQSLSNWETLTCGVAQGTLLGPILFLTLIDDAANDSPCPVWKYVDDMNLLETRTLSQPSMLQHALDDLNLWTQRNHMLLNGGKCLTMHVTFTKNPPPPPPLLINETELAVVPSLKVLGLHMQNDLHWDDQVNSMVTKTGRKLFLLKRLKKFNLPEGDLVAIYIGYVRPILEYAVPVWHSGLTKRQSDQLERLQKRACRTIMGKDYCGYSHALQHLGLTTLASRREQLSLKFARSLLGSEFRDWLPPPRAQITGRVTRNNHKLNCPKARTKRYLNSWLMPAVPAYSTIQRDKTREERCPSHAPYYVGRLHNRGDPNTNPSPRRHQGPWRGRPNGRESSPDYTRRARDAAHEHSGTGRPHARDGPHDHPVPRAQNRDGVQQHDHKTCTHSRQGTPEYTGRSQNNTRPGTPEYTQRSQNNTRPSTPDYTGRSQNTRETDSYTWRHRGRDCAPDYPDINDQRH
ncbi:hypothetical protein Bbelb_235900 [Branchiostoma belcheri]|nr:hypothetical protein Bbelb_235900 [Branchiostoma belcheri]